MHHQRPSCEEIHLELTKYGPSNRTECLKSSRNGRIIDSGDEIGLKMDRYSMIRDESSALFHSRMQSKGI